MKSHFIQRPKYILQTHLRQSVARAVSGECASAAPEVQHVRHVSK